MKINWFTMGKFSIFKVLFYYFYLFYCIIFKVLVSVSVCENEHVNTDCPGDPLNSVELLYQQLWTTWPLVLITALGSSARAVQTLSHRAISPVLGIFQERYDMKKTIQEMWGKKKGRNSRRGSLGELGNKLIGADRGRVQDKEIEGVDSFGWHRWLNKAFSTNKLLPGRKV